MKDKQAKTIAITGLCVMGLIATAPFLGGAVITGGMACGVWGLIGGTSIGIIVNKESAK